MRLRIILLTTIAISWLLYKWLPVESDLTRFLFGGLSFSIASRLFMTGSNALTGRYLLKRVRLEGQQAATVVSERARVSVGLSHTEADDSYST